MAGPGDGSTLGIALLAAFAFAALIGFVIAALRYFDHICWACGG